MTQPTTVVPLPRPLSITGAGLTHRGTVRERNEDAILTDPTGSLWAVADGLGGHGFGDLASAMVIDALSTIPDGGDPAQSLVARLRAANAAIHRQAQVTGTMGATVVALMIARGIGHVAWAGDSRAYLWRRGRLRLLTSDHSVVQDMVANGALTPEAARDHPEAHVVTRAIGAEPEVEIDLATVRLTGGDRLLLCSDGLTGCLHDQWICERLGEALDAGAACRVMLADALEMGATDNVSLTVVFIGDG